MSLRRDATLLSLSMSPLLTRVHQIGFLLGDMLRVVGHLGSKLSSSIFEVTLLGEVRLLTRTQRSSVGVSAVRILIGRSQTLGFARDASLGGLGLANCTSFGGLETGSVLVKSLATETEESQQQRLTSAVTFSGSVCILVPMSWATFSKFCKWYK